MNNIAGWFEIPVADMERAVRFYESVFGFSLTRMPMPGLDMAWFPWSTEGTGAPGSLVCNPEHYKPSADGVLIYLSSLSGDLSRELERVAPAGGKVLIAKRQISEEHGYMAVFLDTEGNRIALHSLK